MACGECGKKMPDFMLTDGLCAVCLSRLREVEAAREKQARFKRVDPHAPNASDQLTRVAEERARRREAGKKAREDEAAAVASRQRETMARYSSENTENKAFLDRRYAEEIERTEAHKQTALAEAVSEARLAQQEMARRRLAKNRLLPYVRMTVPGYEAGWVHKDICRELEAFFAAIERKESPRLMIAMPPRHGKTELASIRFSAWMLGKRPDFEIMAASYSADLANKISRGVLSSVRSQAHKRVFPDFELDKNAQSVTEWNTTAGGGFFPTGVGGPATGRGAHCLDFQELIATEDGPWTFEQLLNAGEEAPMVLSYDGKHIVKRKINAFVTRTSDHIYHVTTDRGAHKITGEHPVCVGFQGATPVYRRVDDLRAGDRIFAIGPEATFEAQAVRPVSDVRERVHQAGDQVPGRPGSVREPEPYMLQRLLGSVPFTWHAGRAVLRHLRQAFCRVAEFGREKASERADRVFLLQRMLRGPSLEDVCGRPASDQHASGLQLRPLRRDLQAITLQSRAAGPSVLQRGMLPRMVDWSPYPEGYRAPWGAILPRRVQGSAQDNASSTLCGVRQTGTGFAPSGRKHRAQRTGESGAGVQEMPYAPPSPGTQSVVIAVERVETPTPVGDLEVEGTHCFLLHSGHLLLNCLIIDDPIKNREEAESEGTRQSVIDWYTSTAYTRLAPGGGVLCIQTRWHDSDLSGWLEEQARKDEGDQWRVVKYPAIATHDESYRRKGDPLHADRYPLTALLKIKKAVGPRDWNALYQQNPVPDTGDYFERSDFNEVTLADIPPREELSVYAAWDFAIGQKQDNDYTVGIPAGFDANGNLWILACYRGQWGSNKIIDKMFALHRRWRPDMTGGEHGHISMTLAPFIATRKVEEQMYDFHVEPLKVGRQDKVARARSFQGLVQSGKVYIPMDAPWAEDVMHELLRFPNGKNDDVVDCLAYLGQMMDKFQPVAPDPTPKKESWRDRLEQYAHGSTKSSAMGA